MARPVLSKAQVDAERRRLSATALRLFREHGYESVTLRKLATEAGVSKGQPYSYFASKEELFAYLRADLIRQFSDCILQPAVEVQNPLARIRAILLKFVDFVIAHPEEYRLMFSLRQPDPRKYPDLERARLDLMQPMLDAYEQAIEQGAARGTPAVQAHIAWALVHGLLSLHAANQLVRGCDLNSLVGPAIDQLFEQQAPDSRRPVVSKSS
ncbi:TetR family transcriptional regulator [Mycobacterium antarcticum]|uniref:TetR/AcrR family transcriptional regulator n=1 Tax=unclassified Mycolicibacterium TaxID=2636767 RepID=UPI002392A079|nr:MULTISPECIES: TetR/AcrR family transcriptional regulator [unclassified Mycolicibacterium]BDX33361.1 TetR family transcriptional regulator [Mycolicibacterium sp. TUM20985]GLP83068.1 TetR family transcriptional regulator [Mycolicibacterium sp. TUM20984]